jgi:hypothetical protein
MAKDNATKSGFPFPASAMVVSALVSALVVGLSFVVIKYWPLPVSVAPYFGFKIGALWGLVVGAISGLVLGFITDEKHFDSAK